MLLPQNQSQKRQLDPMPLLAVQMNHSKQIFAYSGETFIYMLRIINLSCHQWENIYLQHRKGKLSDNRPCLMFLYNEILLPRTAVGDVATVIMYCKAPNYPCTTHSKWQLVDQSGLINCSSLNSFSLSVDVLSHRHATSIPHIVKPKM